MPRFHHMWIVGAEVEVRNPAPERDARCEKVFAALVRHASDDTEPYPTQVATFDDGWLEVSFPVWAATRFAALSAAATTLSEACALAEVEVGVVRMAAGESSDELQGYRERVRALEATAER